VVAADPEVCGLQLAADFPSTHATTVAARSDLHRIMERAQPGGEDWSQRNTVFDSTFEPLDAGRPRANAFHRSEAPPSGQSARSEHDADEYCSSEPGFKSRPMGPQVFRINAGRSLALRRETACSPCLNIVSGRDPAAP